jgi:hypothetical protein
MGVLDDAIREHLELKRQHGASADEVTKQEQEALGAVKGQPVTSEPAADLALPAAEAPEPAADLPLPAAEAPEPAADLPVPAAKHDPEPLDAEPVPDEPAAVEGPEDPGAPEPEPWLEPEPETVPPPDADPGEDDVLEETPEFLQETPEHDRLWFEQKPPREFDFDDE